jgi:hypothetical protein
MIFIDGSNFYHGLSAYIKRTAVDFGLFCDALCGDERRLVHSYYYNISLRQATDRKLYADQQRFFAALQRIPHFDLVRGRLVDRDRDEGCPHCGHTYKVS